MRAYVSSRSVALFSLACALAIGACSSSKSSTLPTANGGYGSPTTTSGSGSGTTPPGVRTSLTIKLAVKVKVLNLAADASGVGSDIDVWAGSGPSGGVKLATVHYAQRSDDLTPLASKYYEPTETNGQKIYPYQISFVASGTTPATALAVQNEDAYPGDELTMVIASAPRVSQGGTPGYATQVLLTKTGSGRTGGGLGGELFSGLKAPANDRLLYFNAFGLVGTAATATTGSNPPSYDLGLAGSGCVGEVGASDQPPVSTANSRVSVGQSSFSTFAYTPAVSATAVGVYPSATQCAGTALAQIPLPASSGDRVIAFLYGPLNGLKSLTFAG